MRWQDATCADVQQRKVEVNDRERSLYGNNNINLRLLTASRQQGAGSSRDNKLISIWLVIRLDCAIPYEQPLPHHLPGATPCSPPHD
ncbi:uncharacterized protein MYCFIDRAFT_170354 [Pseudocercospora fijiensis CIRAD86]|uniref:Uncharacterized protein n=1 Tax=Pseudocercospora fijiensis (strain CIRAD86) TaxID=383855 RepID=N1Q7R1_PSEFD|nr:uncharacterized protein MYCFIDRAFT_170354 [Pseudocercospora fijiensis CIRAD86]EME88779.1 hypothetical protein MYCFIDRAFT_170354 [Pseudocercospora fijiensis CIRAD86]